MKNTKLPNFKPNIEVTERAPKDDPKVVESAMLLQRAAEVAMPTGMKYLGSAVVHFYGSHFDGSVAECAAQAPLGATPENLAQIGIRGLTEKIMMHFGRVPPKKRS